MRISVRTRFEIFKRDHFTCLYCGRTSPDVVLEVDHIVPICEGGSDDSINLTTSCWDCNHGKSGVPLAKTLTGEDPHDKAIAIKEQERQLREYDRVVKAARRRREKMAWELLAYWMGVPKISGFNRRDFTWIVKTLAWLPSESLREYMDAAERAGVTNNLRYVKGCVRNLREKSQADGNG
jgi:hypothetical protein